MKFYNSLSKNLEELKPLKSGKVTIYTCGPTVYKDVHIGNLRTYLTTDILRRLLKENEYEVVSVMNITDVGHFRFSEEAGKSIDPVVEEANNLGITPFELSKKYTDKFLADTKKLNFLPQDEMPKASDHIEEIIEVIKVLIDKGFAYETEGNVYFNVEKFKDYGKLSGNTLDKMDQLLEAVRISSEADKKDSVDFSLWKKADDRIMSWDSPWGQGVPGWHIECSVMSMKYLGVSIDFHLGGEDLIFPHHEDEIAQSESFTDKRFVNNWLHTGFLTLEEEKMSRSKGNIYTLSDLEKEGFHPLAFRYLTYQTHYRSKMNFSFEALEASSNALKKLYDFASNLPEGKGYADKYEMEFNHALMQDLNMPKALAIVWEMIRSKIPDENKAAALSRIDKVLGLKIIENSKAMVEVSQIAKDIAAERVKLRREGRFKLADELRIKLEKMGYEVKDDSEGQTKLFKKI